MFETLICRTRGHDAICTQEATLYPDGRVTLEHEHTCKRCNLRLIFPTEELPAEAAEAIRAVAPVSDNRITMLMNSSYTHPDDGRIH
jgi:hypothetical protein